MLDRFLSIVLDDQLYSSIKSPYIDCFCVNDSIQKNDPQKKLPMMEKLKSRKQVVEEMDFRAILALFAFALMP